MNPNVRQGARRVHTAQFKAKVLAQCCEPGASIAAVAMANGVNANLVRKWLVGRGLKRAGLLVPGGAPDAAIPKAGDDAAEAPPPLPAMRFVPVGLATASSGHGPGEVPGTQAVIAAEASGIHIELRRGDASVAVQWPASQAHGCVAWLSSLAGALLKG